MYIIHDFEVNGKSFDDFFEIFMSETYYEILGVSQDADFSELKKAYYRCAKRCHPDLYENSEVKKAEFQELVQAFNVLSDAVSRHEYDLSLGKTDISAGIRITLSGPSIMDCESDEILEELVVGNDLPFGSTLATLMADLAGTELFLLYREGQDHVQNRRSAQAEHCFSRIVKQSPRNIVFRIRYARVLCDRGRFAAACRQYRAALEIGKRRQPPLLLRRINREYDALLRRNFPLRAWFRRLWSPPQYAPIPDAADEMIQALNRAFARSLAEQKTFPAEKKEPRQLDNQ